MTSIEWLTVADIGICVAFAIVAIVVNFRRKKKEALAKVNDKSGKARDAGKTENSKKIKADFFTVMNIGDLSQEEVRYISDRNLHLAGFTLTALALILGLYFKEISDATLLIQPFFLSMLLFFLASQMAHEAERFWHLFVAEILHYFGVFSLMFCFVYFMFEKLQQSILTAFSFILFVVTIVYFLRGILKVKKFYKKYKIKSSSNKSEKE